MFSKIVGMLIPGSVVHLSYMEKIMRERLWTMNNLRIRFEIFLVVVLLLIGCIPVVNAEKATSGTNLTNITANSTVYPAKPFITIDPIGNHTIGDVFFINGTTNLPVSQNLTIDIVSYKYIMRPHMKNELGPGPHSSAYMKGIPISSAFPGTNRWYANVTDIVKELESGDYLVQVDSQINESCNITGCRIPDVSTTAVFTLLPANTNIKPTALQTTFQNSSTVQPQISATTVPHTTQSASLPLALPIVVFVVIVILKSIQKKKNDD
jgi:hypothetical protein